MADSQIRTVAPCHEQYLFPRRKTTTAEVKLNPVFEGFRHKIGDRVLYNRNGELFVRRKGSVKDAQTAGQIQIRDAFAQLVVNRKESCGILHRS